MSSGDRDEDLVTADGKHRLRAVPSGDRVDLRVRPRGGDPDWVELTPDEAIELAKRLVTAAAEVKTRRA